MILVLSACFFFIPTGDAFRPSSAGDRTQLGIQKASELAIQIGMKRDKVLSLMKSNNYTSFSTGISTTYWYPETRVKLFFREGVLTGYSRK